MAADSPAVEYSVELPKSWGAGIALMWDNKWGHYNSWMLEFYFGKIFMEKRISKNCSKLKTILN